MRLDKIILQEEFLKELYHWLDLNDYQDVSKTLKMHRKVTLDGLLEQLNFLDENKELKCLSRFDYHLCTEISELFNEIKINFDQESTHVSYKREILNIFSPQTLSQLKVSLNRIKEVCEDSNGFKRRVAIQKMDFERSQINKIRSKQMYKFN